MKRIKKLAALLIGCIMLVGGSLTVSAADYTNITEESTDSSAEIELNIEIDSTFTVGIPISTDIDENGVGAYQVSVKGDIDPRYKLVVAPVDGYTDTDGDVTGNVNFLLKDQSNLLAPKPDVVVNIVGTKTEFICTDVNLETETLVDYTLNVQEGQKLSAGVWSGTIKYTISLKLIDTGATVSDGDGE